MAEFCLQCWNELNGTNDDAKKYILSKDLDLCEGCNEWRNVIVAERKYYYLHKLSFIIFPFKILYYGLRHLQQMAAYWMHWHNRTKNRHTKV